LTAKIRSFKEKAVAYVVQDMVRKLREDPLFQIRRQEQAARESMCGPQWDQNGTHWKNILIPSQYPYGYIWMHGICDTDSMWQTGKLSHEIIRFPQARGLLAPLKRKWRQA